MGSLIKIASHYNMKDIMKILTISLLFTALIIAVISCNSSSDSNSEEESLVQFIDSLVLPHISNREIAGCVVGIHMDDTLHIITSYGYSNLEEQFPMNDSTSFQIGSITKQFTAVAIFQLYEKGLISLDDEIGKYLDFNYGENTISIRDLLNHTSGIKGYSELQSVEHLYGQKITVDTLLRLIENEKLNFLPGEAMMYSNSGYFLLGLIIENVTGLTYEEYLKRNILSIANLNSSYPYDKTLRKNNQANGYDWYNNSLNPNGDYDQNKPCPGVASLCSNVDNLFRWNSILHESDLLFGSEYYNQLMTQAKLHNGISLRYSNGIANYIQNGHTVYAHSGGVSGFTSSLLYFPEYNLSVVVLVNSLSEFSPSSISEQIADFLLPSKECDNFLELDENLEKYCGIYKGQGRESELEIQIEAIDNELIYRSDTKGNLTYIGKNKWALNKLHCIFIFEADTVTNLYVDEIYSCCKLNNTNCISK